MNGMMGWIVAAAVIVAAGVFYFWPQIMKAPASSEQGAPEQVGEVKENIGDPMMSGLWQSTSDEKFTREIRPDGVVIDRYQGDAAAGINGEWSTSDAAALAAAGITLSANLQGLPVIEVVWEGGAETTFFVVNELNATSMTTTDLSGRGSVTMYKKITQLP